MTMRQISYAQAIHEATDQCMAQDERVYVMGLGVTDPKAIFSTTQGLEEKYGSRRVLDMPLAENGMTGVAIGSALAGMRPILVHQRIDFTLLALDQVANSAAKWYSMFGFKTSVPLTVRMLIGRGWGQGPQHSQSLQAMYAHFPGLKVVMPATASDAKGLLIASIRDNDPVMFLEHRWLHNVVGEVREEPYTVPIGKARVARSGSDVSIAATSLGVIESLRAAELLEGDGIAAEVIDVRTIKPLDSATILASVEKTGRLIAVDHGWRTLGFAGELVATVAEGAFTALKAAPIRIAPEDTYVPTSAALANEFYPSTRDIVNAARSFFGLAPKSEAELGIVPPPFRDVPDPAFRGPF